jgi:hypothetical protein
MRQLLFTSLCFTAVLLAGCAKNDSGENASANLASTDLPRFLVRPGAVTGDRAGGINGTFTLTQATAGTAPEGGIPGDQLGGACIIFRAEDLGYSQMAQKVCHNDKACDTGEGSGYCSSDHKCWARPAAGLNDPLCRRSSQTQPQTPWDVDVENKISQNPIPVPAGLKANAQARVIALTKGQPKGLQGAVLTWGDQTTIP